MAWGTDPPWRDFPHVSGNAVRSMTGEPHDRPPRTDARHRVLKGAAIVFNQGNSVIDCQVRDLSRRGARLKVPSTRDIPDVFDLRIHTESAMLACCVVWRTSTALGIVFRQNGKPQPKAMPTP
jgi:hypothetical protein